MLSSGPPDPAQAPPPATARPPATAEPQATTAAEPQAAAAAEPPASAAPGAAPARPAEPEPPAPVPPGTPPVRASDQDRDAVVTRLQVAFAERRLDDDEFDQRMRAALTARTSTELDRLTADLPAAVPPPAPAAAAGIRSGRYAISYKSSIRRGGRWRVPGRFTPVVYKGSGWIDLRAAELAGPLTRVTAVAYKSQVEILVPPGVRVEIGGIGVSKGWSTDEAGESQLRHDAPVIHVTGIAYKGTVQVRTRPPGRRPGPASMIP